MDKTLEIIIAATVILLTALTVMFMVGGQSESFNDWMNNTKGDAECSLKKTQYENACNCGSDNPNNPDANQIKAEAASNSCSWTNDITDCSSVCN